MACALTRDDPVSDCQGPNWTVVALVVTGVLIGVVLLSVWIVRRRRR